MSSQNKRILISTRNCNSFSIPQANKISNEGCHCSVRSFPLITIQDLVLQLDCLYQGGGWAFLWLIKDSVFIRNDMSQTILFEQLFSEKLGCDRFKYHTACTRSSLRQISKMYPCPTTKWVDGFKCQPWSSTGAKWLVQSFQQLWRKGIVLFRIIPSVKLHHQHKLTWISSLITLHHRKPSEPEAQPLLSVLQSLQKKSTPP